MTRDEKRIKFFKHMKNLLEKQEQGILIDLTEIYEDYGCPPYMSPKREFHYPRGKQIIEYEIQENHMQVERVIRYDGKKVYGNYALALMYLKGIDAYNAYLVIDMLFMNNPTILDEFGEYCSDTKPP